MTRNPQAPHINSLRTVAYRGTVYETELPVGVLQECKDAGWLASDWGRITLTKEGRDVLRVSV